MKNKLACLFVVPNGAQQIYQKLSETYTAIETPTWALLLAQTCRSKGFGVAILDCKAENLTPEEATKRIAEANPRLVCIVVYGQNPSAGIAEMTGTVAISEAVKQYDPNIKICLVGSYPSALPRKALEIPSIDFVLINEGVQAIQDLLKTDLENYLDNVNGMGFKKDGRIVINKPSLLIQNDRMNEDLPGYAWDLLPYKERPLDLYRAHVWHANWDPKQRSPFAAIYTSLGCQFKCAYCMINILNRTNYNEGIHAADSAGMRFWTPEHVVSQIEELVNMGVSTIRLSDEMFLLNRKYFEPILNLLIEKELSKHINMWVYARIDATQHTKNLDLIKKAGINYLALGIETSSDKVRKDINKQFSITDIYSTINRVKSYDIGIVGDYIFGLPEDNYETMQQTLNFSLELLTEHWNGYTATALPGSPLYFEAIKNGWELPSSFAEYSFLSYYTKPLPSKYLSGYEILKFRDNAFNTYFTHEPYLQMMESKYGKIARDTINDMVKIKLKRKYLGD